MDTLVSYRAQGAVARLTLDSPGNRNALSTRLVQQVHEGLTRAQAEPEVRVMILGHTGGTFCAGADLSEASSSQPSGSPADLAVQRARELTRLLRRILECPLPVIAAIDGHVRAGGLGLVGACDIAVAGTSSTFALSEARIGVAPSIISLTLLPKMTARAVGRYFVTGERFGSVAAAEMGLITVAVDDVAAKVDELTAAIALGSPQGLAESKALTTAEILDDFDRRAEELTQRSAELFVSDEAREGMLAFLQKRPPRWVG